MDTIFGRGYPEPPAGVSRREWGEQCDTAAFTDFMSGKTGRMLKPLTPYHWLGVEADSAVYHG